MPKEKTGIYGLLRFVILVELEQKGSAREIHEYIALSIVSSLKMSPL